MFLRSGVLLENKSDDGTTVLENLYKILNSQRLEGLDGHNVLLECLDIIENPCVITQCAEDIPEEYLEEAVERISQKEEKSEEEIKQELEIRTVGTCAAASVEYYLAHTNISEFMRIVEGLTSEEAEVKKNIRISPYTIVSLDIFKTPYEIKDNKYFITIKPDDNAIWLARIQNSNKNDQERSMIDVLLQSAIMNLGSKQTYDSLSDKRAANDWTNADSGLISFEASYAKEMITGEEGYTEITMSINADGIIEEQNCEKAESEIKDELKDNGCTVIGFAYADEENKIWGGHEVTIIGTTTNINGEEYFVCQDSGDYILYPSLISKEELKNVNHVEKKAKRLPITFGSLTMGENGENTSIDKN